MRDLMLAEFDAINLYEQMANIAKSEEIKDVLLDVAKEERTHVGEFLAILSKFDEEQVRELEKGRKEVEEILGGD